MFRFLLNPRQIQSKKHQVPKLSPLFTGQQEGLSRRSLPSNSIPASDAQTRCFQPSLQHLGATICREPSLLRLRI